MTLQFGQNDANHYVKKSGRNDANHYVQKFGRNDENHYVKKSGRYDAIEVGHYDAGRHDILHMRQYIPDNMTPSERPGRNDVFNSDEMTQWKYDRISRTK